MELRSVSSEGQVKYPKKSEMNKKKINSSVPNTWKALGITSVFVSSMAGRKVCAISTPLSGDIQQSLTIAGGVGYNIPNPTFILLRNVDVVIALISIITCIIGFVEKRKLKKCEDESAKLKKKYKTFFTLSIITFIIFLIIFGVLIIGIIPSNIIGYY